MDTKPRKIYDHVIPNIISHICLSLYQRSIDLFWTQILWTLPATTFGVCRKSSLSVYQPLCGWTGYWICIQAIYRDLHLYLYIYIWMFQKVVQYPKNMLSLLGQKTSEEVYSEFLGVLYWKKQTYVYIYIYISYIHIYISNILGPPQFQRFGSKFSPSWQVIWPCLAISHWTNQFGGHGVIIPFLGSKTMVDTGIPTINLHWLYFSDGLWLFNYYIWLMKIL